MKPLTDAEIRELLTATLHGPLPVQTMNRVFATLAEVPGRRELIRDCWQDAEQARSDLDDGKPGDALAVLDSMLDRFGVPG